MDALERSIDVMEGKDDPLRNAGEVDSAIPAEISDVIVKAMAIRREERYDSASIMRQVLRTALVRLKEREADETTESNVAVANLKPGKPPVQSSPPVQPAAKIAEAKRLAEEAAERQETEMLKQQVRDAEEQRLAAEASRRIQEEAAELPNASDDEPSEDDLLQILLPTSPAPVETAAKDADVPKTFKEEPAKPVVEAVKEPVVKAGKENKAVVDRSYVRDEPAAESEESEFEPSASSGFPLGMPLIALGIGAVLIIIVAAWVLMPGSSGETAPPVQTQSGVATEPAPSEPTVQAALPANTQTADPVASQPTSSSAVTPDQPKAKKPTPTPKPAKAAPETKKAVTVDDLINDN